MSNNIKLVKTLETDTPIQEIDARWAHMALYPDIMPSLQRVKPLGDHHWLWQQTDGDWTVDHVQRRPSDTLHWHARKDDIVCLASVLFQALKGGKTRVVYTRQYPNGLGTDTVAEEIEADMATTLRRSAGLIDRPEDEAAKAALAQVLAQADQGAQETLAQVIESGEMLQATLSKAADTWARTMTDSLKLMNVGLWHDSGEAALRSKDELRV